MVLNLPHFSTQNDKDSFIVLFCTHINYSLIISVFKSNRIRLFFLYFFGLYLVCLSAVLMAHHSCSEHECYACWLSNKKVICPDSCYTVSTIKHCLSLW